MKTLLFIALVVVCSLQLTAQDAIATLKSKNLKDSTTLARIEQFVKGGYELFFDCGTYTGDEFITTAKSYLGVPYKFGGTTRAGLDCSGLIFKTMGDLGLNAPHGAQELARFGQIILDKNELRYGDVIFFTKTYNTNKLVTHAAFVIEDNQMIHASSTGVHITPLDEPQYWNKHYLFGTRIFNPTPAIEVLDSTEVVVPVDELVADTMEISEPVIVYDLIVIGKISDSRDKDAKKALVASYKDLPLGTTARITNQSNGKTVEVTITDNETAQDENTIILSKASAKIIGMKKGRDEKVMVERVVL